jgi:hypothetical protein
MNGDEEGRANVLHVKECWACGAAFESVKAGARCCGRPLCRSELMDVDALMFLRLILAGCRWAGGEGWERGEGERREYRERMERAVGRLAEDTEPLSELLIELMEEGWVPVLYPAQGFRRA